MGLDASEFLKKQGWKGHSHGLRKGSRVKPLVGVKKSDNGGIGKNRDEAFQWWDSLYSAVNVKISTAATSTLTPKDSEFHKTKTGIISPLPPPIHHNQPTTSRAGGGGIDQDLLGLAKRDAARRQLYSMFIRGETQKGQMSIDAKVTPEKKLERKKEKSRKVTEIERGEKKKSKKRKSQDVIEGDVPRKVKKVKRSKDDSSIATASISFSGTPDASKIKSSPRLTIAPLPSLQLSEFVPLILQNSEPTLKMRKEKEAKSKSSDNKKAREESKEERKERKRKEKEMKGKMDKKKKDERSKKKIDKAIESHIEQHIEEEITDAKQERRARRKMEKEMKRTEKSSVHDKVKVEKKRRRAEEKENTTATA